MNIEDKICAQSQAIRLSELGVNCFSLSLWETKEGGISDFTWNLSSDGAVPAYDVAELGLMLGEAAQGAVFTEFGDWLTHWDEMLIERHPTEAQCRAALLIHLLETGKLTPDQVNSHL